MGIEASELALAGAALEAKIGASTPQRPNVLAGSFPEQIAFVQDPASLKVAFCTRRAAKSFSFGLECVNDSYDWPTANYLFLGLVREEAKRIFWKDVLKAINSTYRLGMKCNETTLTATMPNGATIYIGAADANEEEWRKLLGQKYRKIAIDEAQDWQHADLEDLVFHTLKPACADFHGSIELLGTPGKINKGLFHDITPKSVAAGIAGERPAASKGWSVHCWDTSANTAKMADGRTMREHWEQETAELRAMKPGIEETPWYRRNYKGEKVIEDSALVYRYLPGRNDFEELPRYPKGEWHYVNGSDLGYNDPTSWVEMAYHDHDPCLYILSAEKESGLDVTAVATRTKAKMAQRDYDALVIDNANKQAVEEMRRRHEIPWKPADKTGKSDFIEIMNGEFITGRIKLKSGPACDPLREEYASLIWDQSKPKREEHAACENHAADGALYGWRYCFQYLSNILKSRPPPGSPEAIQEEEDALERAAEEQYKAEQELQEWPQ